MRKLLFDGAVHAANEYAGRRGTLSRHGHAGCGDGCGPRNRGWRLKQLLNTLYVTTQGAYLAKDGETVAVRVEQETKLRVPIHTLNAIVCFGQISCSPFLMGMCGEVGVALTFLSEHGQFLARVHG